VLLYASRPEELSFLLRYGGTLPVADMVILEICSWFVPSSSSSTTVLFLISISLLWRLGISKV
jgi:hypothetical protein